jgi:hypothetical protein
VEPALLPDREADAERRMHRDDQHDRPALRIVDPDDPIVDALHAGGDALVAGRKDGQSRGR